MRRSEKEIKDRAVIDGIIRECRVCRLGLVDEQGPYVVPLCFGYDGAALYFHCALEGRKLAAIRRDSRVCFEFDIVDGVREAAQACSWSMDYRSVIGFGRAEILTDPEAKRAALQCLMAQYAPGAGEFSFPDHALQRTCVFKVTIDSITGKHSDK